MAANSGEVVSATRAQVEQEVEARVQAALTAMAPGVEAQIAAQAQERAAAVLQQIAPPLTPVTDEDWDLMETPPMASSTTTPLPRGPPQAQGPTAQRYAAPRQIPVPMPQQAGPAPFTPVFGTPDAAAGPPVLPPTVRDLDHWSQALITYGNKHKGKTYRQVFEMDPGYVDWSLARRRGASAPMLDFINWARAWRQHLLLPQRAVPVPQRAGAVPHAA